MTTKLPCPGCGSADSKIVDSRSRVSPVHAIYRRRVCQSCGYRFSTYESYKPADTCEVLTFPLATVKMLRAMAATPGTPDAHPVKIVTAPVPDSVGMVWCDQCESRVPASDARSCRSRLCTLKHLRKPEDAK